MSLAERLIEQSFANANVEVTQAHSDIVIGALKAVEGERVLSVAIADNGWSGLKLVALTSRALVIVNGIGEVAVRQSVDEIADISVGLGTLSIVLNDRGMKAQHTYGLADKSGAYDLQNAFNEMRRH